MMFSSLRSARREGKAVSSKILRFARARAPRFCARLIRVHPALGRNLADAIRTEIVLRVDDEDLALGAAVLDRHLRGHAKRVHELRLARTCGAAAARVRRA